MAKHDVVLALRAENAKLGRALELAAEVATGLRAELDAAKTKLAAHEEKRAKDKAVSEAFKAKYLEAEAKEAAKEKAPGKKIYRVLAEQQAEFYVYAENKAAAEALGEEHAADVIRDVFDAPTISVSRVDPSEKYVPDGDSLPYGAEGDDEEKTVADILADQLEREKEAEAKADFERRQLKLFPEVPRG